MQAIRTICFDLDDTLWDMSPVIPRAEQALHSWFAANYPRVAELYTPARMRQLRVEAGARYPELIHDLSELRRRMLRGILRAADYDEEVAEAAFEVFFRARNDVQLFADVVPALERLRETHRLLALTNGNACLDTIGIARYFDAVYTARELGVAKPARAFFERALDKAQIEPGETLHVGDHPVNDIKAAQEAGLLALWINRTGVPWGLEGCTPDHELDSLTGLPGLLV